jgi:hypothetical protein
MQSICRAHEHYEKKIIKTSTFLLIILPGDE